MLLLERQLATGYRRGEPGRASPRRSRSGGSERGNVAPFGTKGTFAGDGRHPLVLPARTFLEGFCWRCDFTLAGGRILHDYL